MRKARSTYSKLAALCAILAITLGQGSGTLSTTASQSDNPFRNVNLLAEAQTVDRYCNALDQFEKDLVVLRRKTSITHEELDRHKSKADVLKNQWSDVQRAVRSTINILKAADLWGDFDNLILPRIGDAKVRNFISANGGMKRAFEEALLFRAESDDTLSIEKNFRSRVRARAKDLRFERGPQASGFSAVEVAYSATAPKFGAGLLCLGATIRKGISSTVSGGPPSDKASCMFTCRCISPDMGCSHCDGL